ncbi:MAG: DUF4010 domain-containing protein, partial [Gammaproteobacteria bacterium]|nr:DUF4010 domain-containing protein [Gammaproteobacteria bacterium]
TATIAAMGTRCRHDTAMRQHAIGAALLSSVATPLQLLVMLAAIDRDLVVHWLLPSVSMALVAAASAGFWLRGAGSPQDHVRQTFEGRAFQPLQAIVFSVTVTSLLWAASWLAAQFGSRGAAWGVMLGGFADAHSAIASAATLVRAAELDASTGALAILGALASNTLMKLLLAFATGGRRYAAALAVPLLAMWLVAAALLVSPSWPTAVP